MICHRPLASLLMLSLLMTGILSPESHALAGPESAPVLQTTANQWAGCASLVWYAGLLQTAGESIDAEEASVQSDDLSTWTDADYDRAIALTGAAMATLDRIMPPAAAAAFHQSIRDSVALYQQALETMKTNGPFAILAYMDQFDRLATQAANLALPLEEQCNIALWDNDGDGEPEAGPGVATPITAEETVVSEVAPTATEPAMPVGFARDGRPIMPIGTTVQLGDAFSLTVVSVDQNAVDAVPESPPAGYQYVNVELTLGHVRDQTDAFDLQSLIAVGGNGPIYSAVGNSCGVVDGQLSSGGYTGTQTMTGHVCFVIASRDVAGLILYDQTQPPDQLVYLSLDPAAG